MTTTPETPLTEIIKILPGFDPYADCEGYHFDEALAKRCIGWIERFCTFTKGLLKGMPFLLEPWEKAVVANAFGWLDDEDGSRRFQEIFIYVPRKNGKTELMAAINNLILFCDGEEGGEIYTAASNEDQAKIVWDVSKIMIEASEKMTDNCQRFQKSIVHPITGSFYKFIPANPKGTHGANASSITVDELHVCDEDHIEVLESSQGARFQPLFWFTTTADFDRPSICNKVYDRACSIRDGESKDPNFLPVIYEATKDDDWKSEDTWRKANPNYGVSLNVKKFKRDFNKAIGPGGRVNTFKRLRLNMRTEQSERWIDIDLWDECGKNKKRLGDIHNFRGHPDDLAAMEGKVCIAGLDLSTTTDITALELLFPEDGNKVISFFWMPKTGYEEKEKSDKVPYKEWADGGWLTMTPGNRIDHGFIEKQIIEIIETVKLKVLGFDRWGAADISLRLSENEGVPMAGVGQGHRTMSPACDRLEADMATGNMDHGGNPVLRWMALNVMIKTNEAGFIKIDKEKSGQKVDGMAALADCYACLIADAEEESPYENRGFRYLGGDDDSHG